MEGVQFIHGLDKDKIYIIGFDPIMWDAEQISQFMQYAKDSGLNAIGVWGDGVKILEPTGFDREKLKELLNG